VWRRGRACQIIDTVDLKLERVDDIVAHEFKTGITNEMLDIGFPTSEEVIETDDFIALFDEAVAEMGTEESGSASDQYTHKEKGKAKSES
jgi:hypothetical protein